MPKEERSKERPKRETEHREERKRRSKSKSRSKSRERKEDEVQDKKPRPSTLEMINNPKILTRDEIEYKIQQVKEYQISQPPESYYERDGKTSGPRDQKQPKLTNE